MFRIPYLFLGCSSRVWFRQLRQQNLAVPLSRVPAAMAITCASLFNSLLGTIQNARFNGMIEGVELKDPPLFIIGHWRSGTTLTHELLSLDPNATFPNNYCCFAPHHFLLTERLLGPYFDAVTPPLRPMDAMPIGWDYPQEDEIAMVALGARSPYWRFAFPGSSDQPISKYESFESDDEDWERIFISLLRKLAVRENKRIVLKSPTHSFRIQQLLKILPKSRFVYITRTSDDVLHSMIRMQRILGRDNSLQASSKPISQQAIQQGIDELAAAVEESRCCVPRGQFSEIRYEDLIRSPEQQIEIVYDQLRLDRFETVRPLIREHMNRKNSPADATPALMG